jgi:phosphoglycerate dehydrogenase-like enzyme
MLRDGAVLVNTARGDVIDEEALAKEAATGRIRVVLDVYEEEPLSMSSSLRGMDNVILMPHKGGPTQDLRPDAARIVLEDVARFQRGEPMQNEISPSRAKMMTH